MMMHRRVMAFWLCVVISAATAFAAPRSMTLHVDATELPRRLLHARMEMDVTPGQMVLWYPKWIPGTHAPSGPIQNIGGMRLRTADGRAIRWQRDEVEMYRIIADVPKDAGKLVIELDYITNQPSTNSVGVDSFGNSQVGIINFNTVLLYPDGAERDQLQVTTSVTLPEGWRHGTSLPKKKAQPENGQTITFEPRPLVEVIDSPLICGEHLRSIELTPNGLDWPPVWLHVASEAPAAVQVDDKLREQFQRLVSESAALFGDAHFENYHFLLVCTDQLPGMGLEHHASSLNVVKERGMVDEDERTGRLAYLLPHEFVHSWCGKFRRPAAMMSGSYHSPERTALLWVYEGLTQYLGEVLAVRSGLTSQDDHMQHLATTVSRLRRQSGRDWRPLLDTAVASHTLRGSSHNWHGLRRGQDYYSEGALIWLEVDAIIRDRTSGKKSLDDFCRAFFSHDAGTQRVAPFTYEQVIAELNRVTPYDWADLLGRRLNDTLEQMPTEFVTLCGCRLHYTAEPPKNISGRQKENDSVDASDSLGATFDKEGKVTFVSPNMPADEAGLAPDMQVAGVNGSKYSSRRMLDAIADSVTRGHIELLMLDGERFRTIKVPYADGPRYLTLTRDRNRPDILADILKPKAKQD